MSSLSFLFRSWAVTYTTAQSLKGPDIPVGPAGTFPFGTRLCAPVAGIQHVPHVSLTDRHTRHVTARVGSNTSCKSPTTPNRLTTDYMVGAPGIQTILTNQHWSFLHTLS